MRTSIKGMIAVVGIVGLLSVAPMAMAKDGDVIKRGACSGASDWKLKLSPQDGRIEVEFEVDSNKVGQTWQVRLTKNGAQIFSGSRVTQGPSGSFSRPQGHAERRRERDDPGPRRERCDRRDLRRLGDVHRLTSDRDALSVDTEGPGSPGSSVRPAPSAASRGRRAASR